MDVLTRDQIKDMTESVEAGISPVNPYLASQYLETNFSDQPRLPGKIKATTVAVATLLTGSIGARVGLDHNENLQTGWELPDLLNDYIAGHWWFLPPQFEPHTGDVIEHGPAAMAALAVAGIASGVLQYSNARSLRHRAVDAQHLLGQRCAQGIQSWDLSNVDDASVAYVGDALQIPRTIAENNGGSVVQVSHEPVNGVNVVMPQDPRFSEMVETMKKTGIQDAERLLQFPAAARREIFADPAKRQTFIYSVDKAERLILAADEINKLPVFFMGDGDQPVVYETSTFDGYCPEPYGATLRERAEILEAERECPVRVIDISETLINRLAEAADHRRMVLKGSPKSLKRYGASFSELASAVPDIDDSLPPVGVICNTNDDATAGQVRISGTEDDLVVVRSEELRDEFAYRVASNHVFVLGEVIYEELLATYAQLSQESKLASRTHPPKDAGRI